MRSLRVVLVLGLLLALAGCYPVPSLHPLYTEDELVFETGLVGIWATADGKQMAVFEDAGEKSYRVSYSTEGDGSRAWSRYEAHLVRLGNHLFLDVYPDKKTYEAMIEPQAYWPLVRTHTFYRLTLDRDTLQVAYLDDEGLKKKLSAAEVNLGHAELPEDELLVLTAPTPELRALVTTYADDSTLFEDLPEFRRQVPR